MFLWIQCRLQKCKSRNQQQQREHEQEQHRFTARILIANHAAGRVNDKRGGPQLFFVGQIFHRAFASNARWLLVDLTIQIIQDNRLLRNNPQCFDSAE